MKKIIITTTKITHVYIPPNIPDGLVQAIAKRKAEIDRLMAKRKKMIAKWKKQKEKNGGDKKWTS